MYGSPVEEHHRVPVSHPKAKKATRAEDAAAHETPAKVEKPKPKPEKHLTPEELAALRVKHDLASEKSHDVDHWIDKVTHPQYEITGWIEG